MGVFAQLKYVFARYNCICCARMPEGMAKITLTADGFSALFPINICLHGSSRVLHGN